MFLFQSRTNPNRTDSRVFSEAAVNRLYNLSVELNGFIFLFCFSSSGPEEVLKQTNRAGLDHWFGRARWRWEDPTAWQLERAQSARTSPAGGWAAPTPGPEWGSWTGPDRSSRRMNQSAGAAQHSRRFSVEEKVSFTWIRTGFVLQKVLICWRSRGWPTWLRKRSGSERFTCFYLDYLLDSVKTLL